MVAVANPGHCCMNSIANNKRHRHDTGDPRHGSIHMRALMIEIFRRHRRYIADDSSTRGASKGSIAESAAMRGSGNASDKGNNPDRRGRGPFRPCLVLDEMLPELQIARHGNVFLASSESEPSCLRQRCRAKFGIRL